MITLPNVQSFLSPVLKPQLAPFAAQPGPAEFSPDPQDTFSFSPAVPDHAQMAKLKAHFEAVQQSQLRTEQALKDSVPETGGIGSPVAGPMNMLALDRQAETLIDAATQNLETVNPPAPQASGIGMIPVQPQEQHFLILDFKAAEVIDAQTQLAQHNKSSAINNPRTRAAIARLRKAQQLRAATNQSGSFSAAVQAFDRQKPAAGV